MCVVLHMTCGCYSLLFPHYLPRILAQPNRENPTLTCSERTRLGNTCTCYVQVECLGPSEVIVIRNHPKIGLLGNQKMAPTQSSIVVSPKNNCPIMSIIQSF